MVASTRSNYEEQNEPLESIKREHLLKLIALFKKGEEVFGNLHEFQGWLFKPQLHDRLKNPEMKYVIMGGCSPARGYQARKPTPIDGH